MAKITGVEYENGEIMAVFVQALDEKPKLFEPARARGEWIRAAAYNDGVLNTAYCSVCKNYLPISNWDYHNFCPNCGARMKGEQS